MRTRWPGDNNGNIRCIQKRRIDSKSSLRHGFTVNSSTTGSGLEMAFAGISMPRRP